jgi:hypothetical protein
MKVLYLDIPSRGKELLDAFALLVFFFSCCVEGDCLVAVWA